MGGTCINVGCVPSKMLIYPADIMPPSKAAESWAFMPPLTRLTFRNIMNTNAHAR